jgi:sugar lactone lactonase YvrE
LRNILTLLIISGTILVGCGEKLPLPSVVSSPESFGANDTSYIHLTPDWNAATLGYFPSNPMEPVDIAIGNDGYMFIADRNNNRVITVTQSGDLVIHEKLDQIAPVESPIGVAVNAKLNILIVNGSNTIYAWNQFINNVGINAVAMDTTESGELAFSSRASLLDSILKVHPFYTDADANSSFQGVTFGVNDENTIFVTDKGNNRILRLYMVYSGVAELPDGKKHPLFKAVYINDIATFGSGAGTVDNPRGIICDKSGNIYFTQLGGNFFVQKLERQGNSFNSAYTLYIDPIMDLNRFLAPYDVALGESDAIFVLDTGDNGKVSKFHNKGSKAGETADLGKKGLVEATFDQPLGIAISNEEVVYITNTNQNRIERYQYSISEGDIPQEPQ